MKPSSKAEKGAELPDLDLSDAPGFRSKKPSVDVARMTGFSELWLPHFNSQPDFEARRFKTKARDPFKL